MNDHKLFDTSLWGDAIVLWEPEKKPLTPTCTCGISITMGKDDNIQFHSDYCDLIKKKVL
jgi:hypothetical protein